MTTPREPCLPGTAEAAVMAGVTIRRLDHWCRLGLLAAVSPGGTGYDRGWLPGELEQARRIGKLTAAGWDLHDAARFAREGWPAAAIGPDVWVVVHERAAGAAC